MQVAIASSKRPGPSKLLGKRRKSNRRRIHLDPASQFLDARTVRHQTAIVVQLPYCSTAIVVLRVAVRPMSSVTVQVTVYVRAVPYEWLATGDVRVSSGDPSPYSHV